MVAMATQLAATSPDPFVTLAERCQAITDRVTAILADWWEANAPTVRAVVAWYEGLARSDDWETRAVVWHLGRRP